MWVKKKNTQIYEKGKLMGLDITFKQRKKLICPKCGEIVGHTEVSEVMCGGRTWYPLLESFGYYVPYEQRTEENNWCGKDMTLTAEQADEAYRFVKKNRDMYDSDGVAMLIASARYENDDIVVNADW
jgi:hypothetical protein